LENEFLLDKEVDGNKNPLYLKINRVDYLLHAAESFLRS